MSEQPAPESAIGQPTTPAPEVKVPKESKVETPKSIPTVPEKELQRLAKETGVDKETISDEILAKLPTYGEIDICIAVWMSENDEKLGGTMIENATVHILNIKETNEGRIRTINTKKGDKEVSEFSGFIVDGDNIYIGNVALWEEQAPLIEELKIGGTYNASIKVSEEDGNIGRKCKLQGDMIEADKETAAQFADPGAILADFPSLPIAELRNNIYGNGVFTGFVGKIKDNDNSQLLSISSRGANPVDIFVPFAVDLSMIGKKVILYTNYIGLKSGVPTPYGSAIFFQK